jgi:hypothetical protein
MSASVLARLSIAVPVSTQVWLARSSRKMPQDGLDGRNIAAHHDPSFHHSLLCGLSEVGGFGAPAYDRPS